MDLKEKILEHMKKYPNEKDDKFLLSKMAPDTAGPTHFNMVYFLTLLDVWHKELVRILEESTQ